MTAVNQSPNDILLAPLRAELDRCDQELQLCIARRFEIIEQIAALKKQHDISVLQQHRVDYVLDSAADFARKKKLDPSFMRDVYRLFINEACRIEEALIGK